MVPVLPAMAHAVGTMTRARAVYDYLSAAHPDRLRRARTPSEANRLAGSMLDVGLETYRPDMAAWATPDVMYCGQCGAPVVCGARHDCGAMSG